MFGSMACVPAPSQELLCLCVFNNVLNKVTREKSMNLSLNNRQVKWRWFLLPTKYLMKKVAVLSKWSFVNRRITVKWRFTSVNWQITVKQQFTSVNWQITIKWQFTSVNWQITIKQFTSLNWQFTSCKVLNSRFTTVLLITLLDTVEVTPFFQIFFVKQWFTCVNQWFTGVNCCFTINHHFTSCKLPLYCKPPLYKL